MAAIDPIAPVREVHDEDYPWLGCPRHFSAVAMPNGDARYGIEGRMLLLTETRGAGLPKQRLLAVSEALELYEQLRRALGTFERAEAMVAGDERGGG